MTHRNLSTTLQLALAAAALATTTPAGVLAALLVVGLLAAQHQVRRHLRTEAGPASVAVGAGVLAAPQWPGVLDPAGSPRQAQAGADQRPP